MTFIQWIQLFYFDMFTGYVSYFTGFTNLGLRFTILQSTSYSTINGPCVSLRVPEAFIKRFSKNFTGSESNKIIPTTIKLNFKMTTIVSNKIPVDTHDHNSCFICTHQYNNTSHIQYMLSCCHNSVCHNCYIKLDNNSVFMKTCVFCRNAFDGNIFCPCTGVICKCNR